MGLELTEFAGGRRCGLRLLVGSPPITNPTCTAPWRILCYAAERRLGFACGPGTPSRANVYTIEMKINSSGLAGREADAEAEERLSSGAGKTVAMRSASEG